MASDTDTLQFVWIAGHKRDQPRHLDYYVEVVERLTAVTPEIDERVATVLRESGAHPVRERESD
jgi:hypothetical protein